MDYTVRVVTGDKWGAGTDANVFIAMTGEFGDSGERELQDSGNVNKFEKNQEDVFTVSAVELGRLKKLKIRHDNKGGGAAWYLDRVEVEDPKNNKTYALLPHYPYLILVQCRLASVTGKQSETADLRQLELKKIVDP